MSMIYKCQTYANKCIKRIYSHKIVGSPLVCPALQNIFHLDNPPPEIWEKYFADPFEGESYVKQRNPKVEKYSSEIYVYSCEFIKLASGAVVIDGYTDKFLHSSCLFDRCSRNDSGGSIYYQHGSPIIQDKFCSIGCKITPENYRSGLHSYTDLRYSENLNLIIESTICECKSTDKFAANTIEMKFGICGIHSSNISSNTARYCSGFSISEVSGTATINFSIIEGNHAGVAVCMGHGEASGQYHDFFCNIIKNTQDGEDTGCIHAIAEVRVENCSIFESNQKGFVFSSEEYQLYLRLSIGHFTIINCKVDVFTISSNTGTFTTENVITIHELNDLSHLSSCESIKILPKQDPTYDYEYSCEKTFETLFIILYSD